MRKLLTLITIVYSIQSINAQNSIDFTKKFNTINYQQLGHANGLQEERFSGSYRIYTHAGLRMGYKIEILPNPNRKYIYKGVTYTPNEIPELNDIKITGVGGTLNISNSHLTSAEQVRKITIDIGGYLDESGSLGGNNIEITGKAPKEFESNTPITFVPSTLYWDANKVQIAIEDYINKKNKIAEDKLNQEKYAKLLSEADKLYNSKQYDQALNQYYSANSVKVTDKTRAEEGIAKTRKSIEEEAKKEKTANVHTYKSRECRLAGTASNHYTCPLCIQQNKTETAAKQKEDNRVAVIRAERLKVEEKQKEEERIAALKKKKEEERLENERRIKEQERLVAEKLNNSKSTVIQQKNGLTNDEMEEWIATYAGQGKGYGFISKSVFDQKCGYGVYDYSKIDSKDWVIAPDPRWAYESGPSRFDGKYFIKTLENTIDMPCPCGGNKTSTNIAEIINRKGQTLCRAERGNGFMLLNDSDFALYFKGGSPSLGGEGCEASILFIPQNKEVFQLPHNKSGEGLDYLKTASFGATIGCYLINAKDDLLYTNTKYFKRAFLDEIQKAIIDNKAIHCLIYWNHPSLNSVPHGTNTTILLKKDGTCIPFKTYDYYTVDAR